MLSLLPACFTVGLRAFEVEPGQTYTLAVSFLPPKANVVYRGELQLRDRFGVHTVTLCGIGGQAEVTLLIDPENAKWPAEFGVDAGLVGGTSAAEADGSVAGRVSSLSLARPSLDPVMQYLRFAVKLNHETRAVLRLRNTVSPL